MATGSDTNIDVVDDKGEVIYDWNEDPEIEDESGNDGGDNEEEEQGTKGEGEKDAAKEGEEETSKDTENKEDTEEVGETEGAGEEEQTVPSDELKELRSLLRDQKRQISILEAKLGRTDTRASKALKASLDEDEEGDVEDEELSNVEKLSQELGLVGSTRGPILEVLAETMEQNPKYSDLREVCSRANFDDVFDVVASSMAKEGKGKEEELRYQVEIDVWNMSNPYKYMYEYIKKYHPSYANADNKKETANPDKDKESKDKQTPKEGMKSLAGTDGGTGGKDAGWTSARIDALPEDQLDKVPADIYEKYLAGELK